MSPERALRFCQHSGCPELTSARYCPEHAIEAEELRISKQQQYSKQRGSAASQGYSADWQKARASYLRRFPLCQMCDAQGITTPAVLVHHKTPIQEGGDRLNTNNLMSLCQKHHEQIHGKDRWKRRES